MKPVHSPRTATIDTSMPPAVAPGAMVLLTRLSREIYRRATEDVLGMNLKAYLALNNLREQDAVSQQALGDALHLDPNNCVLLLNVLEAGRLAVRRRDPNDRRRHMVELTEEGRRAVERADRALESVENEVLAALTVEERKELQRLLARAMASEPAARPA